VDCDPGHDDAIALLLALASPEVELCGVTTVAGNQTIDRTTRNALIVLTRAGRDDIPVAMGAAAPLRRPLCTAGHVHGDTGLDGGGELPVPQAIPVAETAEEFLAERLRPPVGLVAVGPLTNVALALRRGARPQWLVWMGGGIGEGDITDAAEFNAYVDPEAAEEVFSAGLDLTMIGVDVSHRALVGTQYLQRLRDGGDAGRFAAALLDFYGRSYLERYGWAGPPVHDALALAVAIDRTLVRTEPAFVHIHTDGPEVGKTEIVAGKPPNARLARDVDARRFLEMLSSRLARMP